MLRYTSLPSRAGDALGDDPQLRAPCACQKMHTGEAQVEEVESSKNSVSFHIETKYRMHRTLYCGMDSQYCYINIILSQTFSTNCI